jgi:hypothetical protein
MVGKKPGKKPFGRDGPPRGYPKDQSVYADPENWRYPLHTPWHVGAARRYFDDLSNRSKYTEEERLYIDRRIDEALKSFEKRTGTPAKRPIPKPPAGTRVDDLSLKELLQLFLGTARSKRAEEMEDSLVSASGINNDKISGKVKDYTVLIDFKHRTIQHDCEDWRKNMDSKNMCKHLGKFMLSLGEERATRLLRDILKNKEQWNFTAP